MLFVNVLRSATLSLLAGLVGWGPGVYATQLGDTAGQMDVGEWRLLNQPSDGSGLTVALLQTCVSGSCSDNVLNYSHGGLWNPVSRELYVLGQGHLSEFKFLAYRESANTWAEEPKPYWDCSFKQPCWGHGYDHSTVDPSTGDVYWRGYNSTAVYRWARATKSWTALPVAPNPTIAGALEYFPEQGGLVLAGGGQVHLFDVARNSWRRLATGLAMGPYHNVAQYDRVNKIVVFGGGNGSNQLYKIDAEGSISPIAPAPINVGVTASLLTADPVSGKLLLFGSAGGVFEYTSPSNSWVELSGTTVPMFGTGTNRIQFRIAVPISTHGVIGFIAFGQGVDARVYLYKHSASSGVGAVDRVAPAAPTGLKVQ